mgnify:CR=1 FL=1
MEELQVVKILMRYANELGYQWYEKKTGAPRVFFKSKIVTIKKQDVVLYHVLHEVAHMVLGPCGDSKEEIAVNEAIAESVSMVVRDLLGFKPHPADQGYLNAWLGKISVERGAFITEHKAEIMKAAKVIAKRVREEDAKSIPFKGCKRELTQSRAYVCS